jgi:hypothetical protein
MTELSDLIAQGQQLLSDAHRSKRIERYRERCTAWAQRVENAFSDDPAALASFRQAKRFTEPSSGIPRGIKQSWQTLHGQMEVLLRIARERGLEKPLPLSESLRAKAKPLALWHTVRYWWGKLR